MKFCDCGLGGRGFVYGLPSARVGCCGGWLERFEDFLPNLFQRILVVKSIGFEGFEDFLSNPSNLKLRVVKFWHCGSGGSKIFYGPRSAQVGCWGAGLKGLGISFQALPGIHF